MVIFKRTDAIVNWFVFVLESGVYKRFEGLNTTTGATSVSSFSASSTTIAWSGTTSDFNGNGNQYIMYCWTSIPGYSKVGSYTGNNTSKTVYTTDDDTSGGSNGFQPTWVMIRNTANGYSWIITDSTRGNTEILYANLQDQEGTTSTGITSFNSNGFTVGSAASFNNNLDTFIYLAIRE